MTALDPTTVNPALYQFRADADFYIPSGSTMLMLQDDSYGQYEFPAGSVAFTLGDCYGTDTTGRAFTAGRHKDYHQPFPDGTYGNDSLLYVQRAALIEECEPNDPSIGDLVALTLDGGSEPIAGVVVGGDRGSRSLVISMLEPDAYGVLRHRPNVTTINTEAITHIARCDRGVAAVRLQGEESTMTSTTESTTTDREEGRVYERAFVEASHNGGSAPIDEWFAEWVNPKAAEDLGGDFRIDTVRHAVTMCADPAHERFAIQIEDARADGRSTGLRQAQRLHFADRDVFQETLMELAAEHGFDYNEVARGMNERLNALLELESQEWTVTSRVRGTTSFTIYDQGLSMDVEVTWEADAEVVMEAASEDDLDPDENLDLVFEAIDFTYVTIEDTDPYGVSIDSEDDVKAALESFACAADITDTTVESVESR